MRAFKAGLRTMGSSTDEAPSPHALLYPPQEPVVSNARVTHCKKELGAEFGRMVRKSSQHDGKSRRSSFRWVSGKAKVHRTFQQPKPPKDDCPHHSVVLVITSCLSLWWVTPLYSKNVLPPLGQYLVLCF